MATIRRRELKTGIQFQVRYRTNTNKEKSKNFSSKNKSKTEVMLTEREANKFLKSIEAQKTLGIAKDESNIKFCDYAEHVFTIHDRNAAPATIKGRMTHLRAVNKEIGHLKLKDLTDTLIEMFLSDMSKCKSDRTLSRYKQIINIVLTSATKKKIIPYNPVTKVDFKLSQENIKEVSPVEESVLDLYLEHTKNIMKYYFAIRLMELTGMRVGEATAITFGDFNFEESEFYITKSRRQDGTIGPVKKRKNGKGIIHSALAELVYEIQEWQIEHQRNFGGGYNLEGTVLCNENGTPMKYSAIRSYMQRLDEKTKIKIRPHQMRHTFISSLIIKQNMNPKEVQILARHAKVQTTLNTYTKLFGGKFETATRDKLENLFANDYQKNKGL